MADVICLCVRRRHDGAKTKGQLLWHFTGWLQRRHEPEPRSSPRSRRHGTDGMVLLHAHIPENAQSGVPRCSGTRQCSRAPVRPGEWWGDNPPYHSDVFVLTHHVRAPLTMEGGTTFYFVTDGIEAAWRRAKAAAKGKDVRVRGGAATVRAYLRAGLVDELHLAQSPVLLGSGESLFSGLDLPSLGYRCVERVPSAKTTHLVLARS